jgi:hypothetical protein
MLAPEKKGLALELILVLSTPGYEHKLALKIMPKNCWTKETGGQWGVIVSGSIPALCPPVFYS